MILSVVMILIVPALSGVTVCQLLSVRKSPAACYLFGSFAEWAFMQLITVPLIMMKRSFLLVVVLTSIFMAATSIYGIWWLIHYRGKRNLTGKKLQGADIFSIVILGLGCIALAYGISVITFKDYDDSRFVVTAVDIVKTNRMLLTNPATGLPVSAFSQDLITDATSPWMVYTAYLAKITGTQASIIAHTMMRHSLTLCLLSVYWVLADTFFGKSIFSKCGFTLLAMLVNVFGIYSTWNAETFAMTRIWQGKSVVAALGIPTVFLVSAWIYKNPAGWKPYFLLYVVTTAMCMMSGMGIIICGIFCGCIGVAFAIMKKGLSVMLKTWIGVILPAVYYFVSLVFLHSSYMVTM